MNSLPVAIVLPIAVAILMAAMGKILLKKNKWLLALVPGSLFCLFLSKIPLLKEEGFINFFSSWYPQFGVNIQLRLDFFSLIMCLLITGIGFFIFLYGAGYLKGHHHINRFYCLILIFMSAMIGIVLSDNLILLFIFWELTTISSYLLVGFNHNLESSRKSAQQALLITGIGGLILFAGLLVLGFAAETFTISEMSASALSNINSETMTLAAILVLIGCFTKSAQFPFHFWLPNAMAAPTPVSAYLHSATMVKAGISAERW
jgi:multicomponent Na+:H+ antiporter subunit A